MTIRIGQIEEEELRHLYNDKKMSLHELGDHYGVSHNTIWVRMKEYDIPRRANRICNINENFFKAWSAESAWLYGWAFGDGCFTDPKSLQFKLGQIDKEVLEKFKLLLNSEHKIVDYKKWDDRYQKYYYATRLILSSKALVGDLKKLSFYKIPNQFFSHALRGFFEAEGHVGWNKRNTPKGGEIRSSISQKDYKLLTSIHNYLKDQNIVKGGGVYTHQNISELMFSVNDSISLYRYIYDNCANMFLQRKKMKFEELIRRQIA